MWGEKFGQDTMASHEFSISRIGAVESGNKATHPEDECGSGKAQSSASYGVTLPLLLVFLRRRNIDRSPFRNILHK